MLEKIKIIKIIKKLRQASIDEGFLKSLRARLEVYISANPVTKLDKERLLLTEERSILSCLIFKFKTMPIPLIIALIVVLSGGGVTMASQASLPGETLYPVKIITENVREAITLNPESKAKLEVRFAAERVAEVKEMLAEKGVEPKGLDVALSRLQEHAAKAAENIEKIGQEGKDVSALAKTIKDEFSVNREALKQTIKEQKKELKLKKQELKNKIEEAAEAGDAARVENLNSELAKVKEQIETLEVKEDETEDVLDREEERLEEKLEARESTEDAIREAQEEKEEMVRETGKDNISIPEDFFKQYDDFIIKAQEAFENGHYIQARQHAKQAEDALKHVERLIEKMEKENNKAEEADEESEDNED